jgi:hypothetical protein
MPTTNARFSKWHGAHFAIQRVEHTLRLSAYRGLVSCFMDKFKPSDILIFDISDHVFMS